MKTYRSMIATKTGEQPEDSPQKDSVAQLVEADYEILGLRRLLQKERTEVEKLH